MPRRAPSRAGPEPDRARHSGSHHAIEFKSTDRLRRARIRPRHRPRRLVERRRRARPLHRRSTPRSLARSRAETATISIGRPARRAISAPLRRSARSRRGQRFRSPASATRRSLVIRVPPSSPRTCSGVYQAASSSIHVSRHRHRRASGGMETEQVRGDEIYFFPRSDFPFFTSPISTSRSWK